MWRSKMFPVVLFALLLMAGCSAHHGPVVSEIPDDRPAQDCRVLADQGRTLASQGKFYDAQELFWMASRCDHGSSGFQRACQFARAEMLLRQGRAGEAAEILDQVDSEMNPSQRARLQTSERALLTLRDVIQGRAYDHGEHCVEVRELFAE